MSASEDMRGKLQQTDQTQIFFTDLNGRLRALSINPIFMEGILKNGVGFDGSSIAGVASVDNSDRLLLPVPDSLRILKFKNETTAFFVGRINNERNTRSQSDPRAVLEDVLARAESEYGFKFFAGPEYEYFLLNGDEFGDNVHTDNAGYFHSNPHDKGDVVRRSIAEVLAGCGVRYEKNHHEVTPSQHEINLEYAPPLKAADQTLLFVHVAQKVAAEYGCHVSFMPKPFDGQNRSAFHIHLSLTDTEGKNLFFQEGADYNLSPIARQFIGGIIKYAREVSIIMASTFNSYKAYVMEREAPVVRGWGMRNRSSMVRVPYSANPAGTRLELRCPDPAGNVYLQLAALIAMGMKGIEDGLDCGKPDMGSVYGKTKRIKVWDNRYLPKCMFEALAEAEKSDFLKNLLGPKMYESYMSLKIADWEEHRTHVTPREHRKYLTI